MPICLSHCRRWSPLVSLDPAPLSRWTTMKKCLELFSNFVQILSYATRYSAEMLPNGLSWPRRGRDWP